MFAECLAGEKALISASHPQVFRPVPCRGMLYCYIPSSCSDFGVTELEKNSGRDEGCAGFLPHRAVK